MLWKPTIPPLKGGATSASALAPRQPRRICDSRFSLIIQVCRVTLSTNSKSVLNLFLQLDATLGPVVLENDVDGLDDLFAGIGLAINDDLVLQLSGPADQHDVLLGKAVVPPAIPGR